MNLKAKLPSSPPYSNGKGRAGSVGLLRPLLTVLVASHLGLLGMSGPAWADCHLNSSAEGAHEDANSVDPGTDIDSPDLNAQSPEITPEDLRDKTAAEIKELAKRLGLKPFGSRDPTIQERARHFGWPYKWRDPQTNLWRLRLDPGHKDPSGKPYENPRAGVPHVHGTDEEGNDIRDPDEQNCQGEGDKHFPLVDPPPDADDDTAEEKVTRAASLKPPTILPPAQGEGDVGGEAEWDVIVARAPDEVRTLRFDFGDGTSQTVEVAPGTGVKTVTFTHLFPVDTDLPFYTPYVKTYEQTATILETGMSSHAFTLHTC